MTGARAATTPFATVRSATVPTAPAAVDDAVLLARAYLNRVAEPACIPLWDAVRRDGPVAVADRVRAGTAEADVQAACTVRATEIDPQADLETAERLGIRLLVPEAPDWPHFALACLEATGRRRAAAWRAGERDVARGGEPIPPLALWTRGPLPLATLGVRTVGIVGSRAATPYGEQVAADLACTLAAREVDVVSGGAYGIDAAAHRGALAGSGRTVIVSAGGLDRPYPSGNTGLFEAAAVEGLLVSESPPGRAPHRGRFLTRNRLIAALSTGTVVVEAAVRSGALNTAHHARALGRPVMAVPGPVTSHASRGCHQLLADVARPALLVTGWSDVLEVVGTVGEDMSAPAPEQTGRAAQAEQTTCSHRLQDAVDLLDTTSRQVFDGLPARRAVSVDELAHLCAVPVLTVLRVLPGLEVVGLAEAVDGSFRAGQLVRDAAQEAARRHRAAKAVSEPPNRSPSRPRHAVDEQSA